MERKAVFRVRREHVELERRKGSTVVEGVYLPLKYVHGAFKQYERFKLDKAKELQVEIQEMVPGVYVYQQCFYFKLYGYHLCTRKGKEYLMLDVVGTAFIDQPEKRTNKDLILH